MTRRSAAGEPEPLVARIIGRSRTVVIVAVAAVLVCAFSLFLLGAIIAAQTVWLAWGGVIGGQLETTDLSIRFLEIVTVMLKAVFFYLIGVGLYSLFISPLNVTVALGVETLNDLEDKIISVVIVIMAVGFLERFIESGDAVELAWRAGALALAVAALVAFQWRTQRAGQAHRDRRPEARERAKVDMFERDHEQQELPSGDEARPREVAGPAAPAVPVGVRASRRRTG